MIDLTIINPTKDTLPIGTNLNQAIEIGVLAPFNPTIGNGTLTEFVSSALSANGSYSVSLPGIGGSGTWNAQASENSDSSWFVQLTLTGTFSGNGLTLNNATATANGNAVTFSDPTSSNVSLTLSQNNGGPFTSGKINISETSLPATLYISLP